MSNDLQRFTDGLFVKGVDVYGPEINSPLKLNKDSFNMASGINAGMGPRYGMAPIQGHMHTEASSSTASPIMQAEDSSGTPHINRERVFGIVPISLRQNTKSYVVLTADSNNYLSFNLISTFDGSDYTFSQDISDGLPEQVWDSIAGASNIGGEVATFRIGTNFDNTSVSSHQDLLKSMATIEDSFFYAKTVGYSNPGKREKMYWFIGDSNSTPTASSVGDIKLSGFTPDTSPNIAGTPFWFDQNNKKAPTGARTPEFYALYTSSLQRMAYKYLAREDIEIEASDYSVSGGSAEVTASNWGTMDRVDRDDGTTPAYADVTAVLTFDEGAEMLSKYEAVLCSAEKPMACILQDGYEMKNATESQIIQPIDLTDQWLQPRTRRTYAEGFSARYTENGVTTNTCLLEWPTFIDGTALGDESAASYNGFNHIRLGGANTGVLRSNTVYEFTYSVYDKSTGYESNVGKPAKFQTGSNDYVRLSIYRDKQTTPGTWDQLNTNSTDLGVASLYNLTTKLPINFQEYRFYYRAVGSFEWLPALFIDAANFIYNPNHQVLWACEGQLAALPGGQPGGFNDYSPLPKDDYKDVLIFNDRAYWLSEKQIAFSLRRNILAYPTKNNIPAATGKFLGAKVSSYPGQSDRYDKLIVFGTENVFVGRFTGIKSQQPVRVSPDSIGYFDVDGSDFELSAWTEHTAFSARAAVVADGYTYWWGPDGMFQDTGSDLPVSISEHLEPYLNELYDTQKVDEIHAAYNSQTKEITWFYPPLDTSDGYYTHGWIFNTQNRELFPAKWTSKIDWAQNIDISGDASNAKVSGKRTLAGIRETDSATIQRPYYYDHRNRSGDIKPKTELLVASISEPSSGKRRLTMASGYDATNFATIAADDFIAIHQGLKYATSMTDCDDMIALVDAVSTGSGYIDIVLPTGASMDTTATLTSETYLPLWHKAAAGVGLNGFNWRAKTRYWEPNGPTRASLWLYLFSRFKFNKWSSDTDPTISMGYRSLVSASEVTDTLTLLDNSDGHCQIYHALQNVTRNAQGQALKMDFSGIHVGHEWVLEYLEAHADDIDGNFLKEFEG